MLNQNHNQLKTYLLVEKAYRLIQNERMKTVNKTDLKLALAHAYETEHFNLYAFVKSYIDKFNF